LDFFLFLYSIYLCAVNSILFSE